MSDGRFGPRLGMGLMNCDGNSQEGGLVGLWIRARETDERYWSWVAVKYREGVVLFFLECAIRHGHSSG